MESAVIFFCKCNLPQLHVLVRYERLVWSWSLRCIISGSGHGISRAVKLYDLKCYDRYTTYDNNTDTGQPQYELTSDHGGLYGPKVHHSLLLFHFLNFFYTPINRLRVQNVFLQTRLAISQSNLMIIFWARFLKSLTSTSQMCCESNCYHWVYVA